MHAEFRGLCEDVMLCCDMCGEKHPSKECRFLQEARRVCDGVVSRARVSLPSALALRCHLDSSVTVVSADQLRAGTLFGPMVAPHTEHITNHQFPVKVFGGEGGPDRYLDTSDEDRCNWMCLVTPSSESQLQNLACIQMGDDIYFVVRRAVPAGAPLHVWYSPFYAAKMRHTLTSDVLAPPESDVTEVVLIREAEPPGEDTQARILRKIEAGQCVPGVSVLRCPLCEERQVSGAALAAHLVRRHDTALAALPTPRCAVCGLSCGDGADLLKHLRSHRAHHRCPHCDKVFTRHQNLVSHPCAGPRRAAQGWPCPHCGRLFTAAAAWQRHQRRHTAALRCRPCGRHFASPATRSAHICRAAASADRQHACPQCSRRFASAASLHQHAALHSDRFACPRCAKRFSGGAPLRRHEALCGAGEQLARNGSAACRRCQASFTSLPALAEHARQHELPHRCSTCGRCFRSRLQLGAHVCSRVEPDRTGTGNTALSVRSDRCGRSATPGSKATPAESGAATAPVPAVCETCAQTFTSKKSLWLHRFTHAERQFACELCGSKFKRKDTMLAHLATHSQPTVPCPYCDKRFKSKKSLAVHARLHTGDARFACDQCGRRFVQKVNMERHRRTHDPDHKQAHRCDVCGKCLSSAHHLRDHHLEHTQGRAYSCSACSRSFLMRRDLQRHLTLAHATGHYQCPFCHMTTKLKSSVSRHMAKMHPAERSQWSAAGFLESLHSERARPSDRLVALEPGSELLLAVPDDPSVAPDDPSVASDDPSAAPDDPSAAPDDPSVAPDDPSAAPDDPSAAPDDPSVAPRPPPAALLTDGAASHQDVLLYVIDVPEMDITFDPPHQ